MKKYYTGSTSNTVQQRLDQHLSKEFGYEKYTASTNDWLIYLEITCSSYKQAMAIEKHIKRMKSRKYIQNLKKYPEILEKFHKMYS